MNNALRCAIFFIVTFCQVASGSASNWPKLKSGKKNKANLENLNLGKNRNSWRTLYAFGQQNGDNLLEPMDDSSLGPIPLSKNFILKGQSYNQVFINSNGLISFIEPIFDFIPVPFPTQRFTSIAPFWADIDTSSSGTISYREVTTNADLLSKISSDISQLPLQFNASMAFIVTWFQVPSFGNSKETNTFQLVLAIDGPISCIIFNYETIEWSDTDNVYAQAGYNLGDGSTFFTLPGSMTASVKDLSKNSNVDYAGRWIYVVNEEEPAGPSCLFGSECFNYSSSNLYFFGPDFGDAIMPRILDSFIGPITMSTDFLFKQMVFSEFFINTNGLISFVEPVTDFIPIPFPIQNYISIAPFWSDTDTTQSGQIYHRQILDSKLLMSIGTDIGRKFQKEFNAKWAYIVTWFNVPYYGGPLHKTHINANAFNFRQLKIC